YLPGMRFFRVALGGTRIGRIAIVIEVPPGSTAYQASDKRYYGRSEYATVPLPDHEIRMRMMRGRVPRATLELRASERLSAEDEYADRMRELNSAHAEFAVLTLERKEMLEAPKLKFDEY